MTQMALAPAEPTEMEVGDEGSLGHEGHVHLTIGRFSEAGLHE